MEIIINTVYEDKPFSAKAEILKIVCFIAVTILLIFAVSAMVNYSMPIEHTNQGATTITLVDYEEC